MWVCMSPLQLCSPPAIDFFYLCVCVRSECVWMREAGWHEAQRHIRGGSSPALLRTPIFLFLSLSLSSSFPPLCCSAEPALLPRLLPPSPKPSCSLRPLCLLVFFSLSLFFSLMSTEWLHRASCLSHTPHLQNHKKRGKERGRRGSAKQDGDSCNVVLPPPTSLLGVREKKHIFKVSPQFSQQCWDVRLAAAVDLHFNVHQLNVVIYLHSRATRGKVTNTEKRHAGACRRALRSSDTPQVLSDWKFFCLSTLRVKKESSF